MYLPHDSDHKSIIRTILTNQLAHMRSAGRPTSPEGLNALQVRENSIYLVQPEYDDEPITSTTQVIPSQLNTCPYSFATTLPTFNIVAYGLLLLASDKQDGQQAPQTHSSQPPSLQSSAKQSYSKH